MRFNICWFVMIRADPGSPSKVWKLLSSFVASKSTGLWMMRSPRPDMSGKPSILSQKYGHLKPWSPTVALHRTSQVWRQPRDWQQGHEPLVQHAVRLAHLQSPPHGNGVDAPVEPPLAHAPLSSGPRNQLGYINHLVIQASDSKFVWDKLLFSHWHWHFQKLLKCHVGSLEDSFHLPLHSSPLRVGGKYAPAPQPVHPSIRGDDRYLGVEFLYHSGNKRDPPSATVLHHFQNPTDLPFKKPTKNSPSDSWNMDNFLLCHWHRTFHGLLDLLMPQICKPMQLQENWTSTVTGRKKMNHIL